MLILFIFHIICLDWLRVLQIKYFDSAYTEKISPIHSQIRYQRSVTHRMMTSIVVQARHRRRRQPPTWCLTVADQWDRLWAREIVARIWTFLNWLTWPSQRHLWVDSNGLNVSKPNEFCFTHTYPLHIPSRQWIIWFWA